TGLSTSVSLSSFVLILFLLPPHRIFAAWTGPVADKRPVWLVAVLTAAFHGRGLHPGAVEPLRAHRSSHAGVHGRAALPRRVVRPALRHLPLPPAGPHPDSRRHARI